MATEKRNDPRPMGEFIAGIGYSVLEWCPTPDGSGPPEAVIIAIELEAGVPAVGIRFKSRRAIDECINVLAEHRDSVWPLTRVVQDTHYHGFHCVLMERSAVAMGAYWCGYIEIEAKLPGVHALDSVPKIERVQALLSFNGKPCSYFNAGVPNYTTEGLWAGFCLHHNYLFEEERCTEAEALAELAAWAKEISELEDPTNGY